MDFKIIWNAFLNQMADEIDIFAYETWFSESELVELTKDYAKVLVQDVHIKKHLTVYYSDHVEKVFADITGSPFKFYFVIPDELKGDASTTKKIKETMDMGVPSDVYFDTGLDSSKNFETFVTGSSNKFAKVSAFAVAEQPGKAYNPLFLYGKSGLGKTHLMHAIGNYIRKNSQKKVLYVTSDTFVNDFLKIVRHNKNDDNFQSVEHFKNKYRNVDVLMIDDIQYLETAHTTAQEFFHTFNDLHTNNKQIVICSDRSPDDLKKLEERLTTRFEWGLQVNIEPPDLQLRLDIINKKIDSQDLECHFPSDVKEYIANNCTSDIRKLEGTITRVIAYSACMSGADITLDLAVEALEGCFGHNTVSKNKLQQIMQVVASHYNLTVDDLKGKVRSANITTPRHVAMFIARIYLCESLAKIGIEFGGRDHTTVINAVEKVTKEIEKDDNLAVDINKIIKQLPWITL